MGIIAIEQQMKTATTALERDVFRSYHVNVYCFVYRAIPLACRRNKIFLRPAGIFDFQRSVLFQFPYLYPITDHKQCD